MKRLVIVGAGAWGSALAIRMADHGGFHITLVAATCDQVDKLSVGTHPALPLATIPSAVRITTTFDPCADLVMIAIGAQGLRSYTAQLELLLSKHILAPTTPIILTTKGIDLVNGDLPICMMRKILPNPILALSGPNYAQEIAQLKPAVTCLAYEEQAVAQDIAHTLSYDRFFVDPIIDVIGTQVVGSFKNIVAIACGIVLGKNLGENIQAAMLFQGIKEMEWVVEAYGGEAQTVHTHAGISDLVLTAFGTLSRNKGLGIALGQGQTIDQWQQEKKALAEGYFSLDALKKGGYIDTIHTPLTYALHKILYDNAPNDLLLEVFWRCK